MAELSASRTLELPTKGVAAVGAEPNEPMTADRTRQPAVERGTVRWRSDLARTVFTTRYVGLLLLAGAAMLLPAIGPNRFWVAGSILTITLPINGALGWWSHRRRRMPPALAFCDGLLAGVYVALSPTTWVPALLLLTGSIGLTTALFGRRRALQALALGAVTLTAGGVVGEVTSPAVGIAGYLIAGGELATIVGALFDDEHRLRVRHEKLLEDVDAIVWEAVPDADRYTFVSGRAFDIVGFPVEAWYEDGFWRNQIHPADRDRVLAQDRAAIDAGLDHTIEYRMIRADGGVVHLRDFVTVVCDATGVAVSLRGVIIDISEARDAEARVRQYAAVVEGIQLALMVARLVDPDDPSSLEIVAANPAACALAQRPRDQVIGQRAVDVFLGIEEVGLPALLADVVRTGEAIDFEDVVSPADPDGRHYALHAFRLGDDAVGVSVDDVTAPRLAAAALHRQATHDALTGLPNRVLLNDRLDRALREAVRSGGRVALLVMDLDQFKEINDALGHDQGDRLLIALSRRLENVLRDADTIARLGGDEFAILLTTDASRAGAVTVARRVTAALEKPFDMEGLSLQTNASIGIALCPDHGTEAEELAKRADVAMYVAKRSAHPYAVYASEDDHSSVRRITLLGELGRALELEEFTLYHQPSYDLRTGTIAGTEALLRWNHPRHGLMLPSEFVDLAEVSGLIQQVTRFVAERAIATASSWPDQPRPLGVSVNLSVRNLYDPDFVRWVQQLLLDTGFAPSRLTLEITESQLMDDPTLAVEVLGALHELGIHTSVDDFGTGQSSLAYLKHLPIDELKIDRSFVAGMRQNASDATIVKSIIDLGHNLGLTIVAEGVEDAETLRMLVNFRCDRAQGFYLAHPMLPDQLRNLLVSAEGLSGLGGHSNGNGRFRTQNPGVRSLPGHDDR
jgi:diguanylate cyclase (GGDEF)-like protein